MKRIGRIVVLGTVLLLPLAEELGKTRVDLVLSLLANVSGGEIEGSVWELLVAHP